MMWRILHHDDFDGLSSAALLVAAGEVDGSMHRGSCTFHALQYSLGDKYRGDLSELFPDGRYAVVDFAYHRQAERWFDHHSTALLTPEDREHYEARAGKHVEHRIVSSCARQIFEHYTARGYDMYDYTELMRAGDMIDRAGYPSAAAYFDADDPAIALNHWLGRNPESQLNEIIRGMLRGSLADLRRQFSEHIDPAITASRVALHQYERLMSGSDVIVVDLLGTGVPFLRYAPYYFQPKSQYAVFVYNKGKNVGLSLGRNPWYQVGEGVHLGQLARQYGGGGHPYASGIDVPQDAPNPATLGREIAWTCRRHIVQELARYIPAAA